MRGGGAVGSLDNDLRDSVAGAVTDSSWPSLDKFRRADGFPVELCRIVWENGREMFFSLPLRISYRNEPTTAALLTG